ncbi:hypothetical protein C0J52_28024 [Blattella germanica]|nr:hypothetical protein C0J52_28024 [Blattella germanica]
MFEQNVLLEEVHLNNNRIEVLHNNIFNNNTKLKYVDLSNNKLTFIDLVIFKDNTNLEFANFSNNEIQFVENKAYVENCPSEYFDISYNKLNTDSLCKINCKEEPKNIAISGNSILCELRETCHSFGSFIVRLCEPKSLFFWHPVLDIFNVKTKELSKQRQSESEYFVHRSSSRWKRQDSIVSTTQKSNGFSSDHSPIATRLPFLNISKNVLNTTSSISVFTPTQSSINNKTLSDSTPSSVSFLSTIFMYSDNYTSYSEEFDFNVTSTVIPLFEFDSPLVLRESTVRGIMFIVIECSVASVLLLRKVICMRDKRRPPVTETYCSKKAPVPKFGNLRLEVDKESKLQYFITLIYGK